MMTKSIKVLYPDIYFEMWAEIAIEMFEKYNWDPVYIVADNRYKKTLNNRFPAATYHDRDKAVVGIPPDEAVDFIGKTPIDQDMLRRFKYDESLYLHMLDRFDPYNNFTYRERVYYYHKMIRYWLGVLSHYKPDIVVYPYVPHMGYDYVTYMLTKELNIETRMFLELPFGKIILTNNYNTHFPIREEYNNYLNSNKDFTIDERIDEYMSVSPEDKNKNEKPIDKIKRKIRNVARGVKRKVMSIAKELSYIFYLFHAGTVKTDFKIRGQQWNYLTSMRNKKSYKRNAAKKRAKLRKYYNNQVEEFDKSQKYIYIPLHYQPEETSCPRGELYAHQHLLIDLVFKCLPEDWKIYVKEHPWQFSGPLVASGSRCQQDYEYLLNIPKVRFIDMSVSSFELIDSARAVATITGTAGWEALVRGIPVLLFGHSWYKGCEGVLDASTIESCQKAIDLINSGYKPDKEKVRLFVYIADKLSIQGALNENSEKEFMVDRKVNVQNITTCLAQSL